MSAENGSQALELLHVREPDVVLLDILMPVMDVESSSGSRLQELASGAR